MATAPGKSKTPARGQATAKGKVAPTAPAKGKPAAPKAAQPSPAIKVLTPAEYPKSHPLVGKKIKYHTIKNPKVRLGTVKAGDGTVVLIDDLWHWVSSVAIL